MKNQVLLLTPIAQVPESVSPSIKWMGARGERGRIRRVLLQGFGDNLDPKCHLPSLLLPRLSILAAGQPAASLE